MSSSIPRPRTHRDNNNALVRSFGQALLAHLKEVAAAPNPANVADNAVRQMQETARLAFEPAYLRGKRQAVGWFVPLDIADRLWLDRMLARNESFLHSSLLPDIHKKIQRARLDLPIAAPDRDAITKSFGSRVEDGYGGVLWTVQEAGFRAGARYLNDLLHAPAIVQEDIPLDAGPPPVGDKKDNDKWALLLLLVTTLKEDEDWIVSHMTEIQIGTAYHTQDDARVCLPCEASETDYWPPAQAPLPGEVCEGGPRCRCWQELIVRVRDGNYDAGSQLAA